MAKPYGFGLLLVLVLGISLTVPSCWAKSWINQLIEDRYVVRLVAVLTAVPVGPLSQLCVAAGCWLAVHGAGQSVASSHAAGTLC